MPVLSDILEFSCFNELRNGKLFDQNTSEFTPNLVANAGEYIKLVYKVRIEPIAFASDFEQWYFNADKVERSSGNFIDDGIIEGNKVRFVSDWKNRESSRVEEFTATVDFISDNGTIMEFTVTAGAQTTLGEVSNVGFDLNYTDTENVSTAILIKWGLIGNDEDFNFISKVSENQQIYYKGGITGVDTMIPLGILRDWVTGGMTVEDTTNETYAQEFTITHTLIVSPWYIIDYLTNLENNSIPELLNGENSLKYVFQTDIRNTLTDIASQKLDTLENLKGVTGWFGENFNGFNNNYEITSISYRDADTLEVLPAISINGRTEIILTVEMISGSIDANYNFGIYHSLLPSSETIYKNTLTNMVSNFLYKREVISGDGTVGDLTTSQAAGVLTVNYIIEFTAQEKLQITENDQYLLWVQVEDSALSAGNSDRAAVIANRLNYTDQNFISGFVTFTEHSFKSHNE